MNREALVKQYVSAVREDGDTEGVLDKIGELSARDQEWVFNESERVLDNLVREDNDEDA